MGQHGFQRLDPRLKIQISHLGRDHRRLGVRLCHGNSERSVAQPPFQILDPRHRAAQLDLQPLDLLVQLVCLFLCLARVGAGCIARRPGVGLSLDGGLAGRRCRHESRVGRGDARERSRCRRVCVAPAGPGLRQVERGQGQGRDAQRAHPGLLIRTGAQRSAVGSALGRDLQLAGLVADGVQCIQRGRRPPCVLRPRRTRLHLSLVPPHPSRHLLDKRRHRRHKPRVRLGRRQRLLLLGHPRTSHCRQLPRRSIRTRLHPLQHIHHLVSPCTRRFGLCPSCICVCPRIGYFCLHRALPRLQHRHFLLQRPNPCLLCLPTIRLSPQSLHLFPQRVICPVRPCNLLREVGNQLL